MSKTVAPRRPLSFEIREAHIKEGVPKDPCECVVALALYDELGKELASIHVLNTKTLLFFKWGVTKEYKTPKVLGDQLTRFDKGETWKLPVGVYQLDPLPLGITAKAAKERAKVRYAAGDIHKVGKRHHKSKGVRKRRPLSDRYINLRERKTSTAKR